MSMKNDSNNADNTTTKIESLWENQKKIVDIPPLSSLNIAKTRNTIACCHTCRGERFVGIRSKFDNRITFKVCMACSGNGTIPTRMFE